MVWIFVTIISLSFTSWVRYPFHCNQNLFAKIRHPIYFKALQFTTDLILKMIALRLVVVVTLLSTLGAFAAPVSSNNDLHAREFELPQILSFVNELNSIVGASNPSPTAVPAPVDTAIVLPPSIN